MMVVLTERSSSLSRDFCLVPISSPFPCPCFYLSLFHPSAVSWFSNFFTPLALHSHTHLAVANAWMNRVVVDFLCDHSGPSHLSCYATDHMMTRFLCSCLRAPKHPKYSFFPPLALPLFALLTCFFASRDVTDHADTWRTCSFIHFQSGDVIPSAGRQPAAGEGEGEEECEGWGKRGVWR